MLAFIIQRIPKVLDTIWRSKCVLFFTFLQIKFHIAKPQLLPTLLKGRAGELVFLQIFFFFFFSNCGAGGLVWYHGGEAVDCILHSCLSVLQMVGVSGMVVGVM